MEKHEPILRNFPHLLHGGDYNPEQWLETPEIWDEDMRLMKLAGINCVSVGIFSWAVLEPSEGAYDFSFLDTILDKLAANGIQAVLATPSGARPAWLAEKYPEVLIENENGIKNIFGVRHNHCYSSSIYRKKAAEINRCLALRYQKHPALGMWHISNEYNGGYCQCERCRAAFRQWLQKRYHNDLQELNQKWWNTFWSHTYTAWEQIMPPSSRGDTRISALNLDWKRFITDLTIEFFEVEAAPLREITPNKKITTNLMGTYTGIDYQRFSKHLSVASWDAYPTWHARENEITIACDTAFIYDINRGLKDGQPFMLMESAPSRVCSHPVNKLKRPGMHALSSLQAVAHGSDTVQYFQWRNGRGGIEKFHGAVVDHVGHENTRVFREVADLGAQLKKLDAVVGTYMQSDVAVIYDWENRWGIDNIFGYINSERKYHETCASYYYAFWKNGINTDVISMQQDFSTYKLIVAPMLYLLKPGMIEKIRHYVENGGTIVVTYLTGEVNETDLCFLGGFPAGELKEVFGVWAEEVDVLYPEQCNLVTSAEKQYKAIEFCEVIHPSEGAEVLASYTQDFYAGEAAAVKNCYGKGSAYYVAFRDDGSFGRDLCEKIIAELKIKKPFRCLPKGVTASTRSDGDNDYIFVQNFNNEKVKISIENRGGIDLLTGEEKKGTVYLKPYGTLVIKRKSIDFNA